jgi:hypothetical protein
MPIGHGALKRFTGWKRAGLRRPSRNENTPPPLAGGVWGEGGSGTGAPPPTPSRKGRGVFFASSLVVFGAYITRSLSPAARFTNRSGASKSKFM